jgi:hypothetical protein
LRLMSRNAPSILLDEAMASIAESTVLTGPITQAPWSLRKSTITIAIKVSSSTTNILRSESGLVVGIDLPVDRGAGSRQMDTRPRSRASVVGSAVHLNGFDASKFNSENGAAFWPVWQAQPCNDLYGETYPFQLQDHLRGRTELLIWPSILLDRPLKQAEPSHLITCI